MYDVKCHAFARIWLSAGGWSNDMDIAKLAQLVQDISEDFVTDLEHEYEKSAHADTH